MDNSTLAQLRKSLLDEQRKLKTDQHHAVDASAIVELDQTCVGRLSRMDAMQSQQIALETERRRQQQLVKIEGALHRLGAGEYGYCFCCGDEIAGQRLKADPTITRCINCAD